MKKKGYLLLVLGMATMFALNGCKDSKKEKEEPEMTADEMTDGSEDAAAEHYYSVQVSGLDEAELEVTTVDEEGNTQVEKTDSNGWAGASGSTIAQIMKEWGVTSIEAECEGYELLGWQGYETVVEVDENGFETYTEKKMYDGKVFTTDEMLNQELPDTDMYFATVWDLTCTECNEQKVCGVYEIDEDRYFVCEDCYKTFANKMGLE